MTRKIFLGLICMTFAVFLLTATSVEAAKPVCGDGICSGGENPTKCPEDCGAAPVCGDGECNGDEDQCRCQTDCGAPPSTEISCDNGIDDDCDGYIDCGDSDCTGDPLCSCNSDGICNEGENCNNCPEDCNSESGGTCDACFKGCDGICNPKKESPDCSDCAPITYCCGLDADGCDEILCGSDCGLPISNSYCGDGNTDAGEECDAGGETADCDIDCTFAVCGDGLTNLTAGEECDDGGETTNCDFDCTSVVCGDGLPNQVAGEECDDGNTTPGDGCDENCQNEVTAAVPVNQFNIGDSIGVGEAADGNVGSEHHDLVWSTGYTLTDIVYSLNERFDDIDEASYYENTYDRDSIFNHAVSGYVMANFYDQAKDVVTAASTQTPTGKAGMIAILLGNNDVCADSVDGMTPPYGEGGFEEQYRAGLDALAGDDATKNAVIHVSGIPAIYWLWEVKHGTGICNLIWWIGGVCQALLQNPGDDCESDTSREHPDSYVDPDGSTYPDDGANCIRRKKFHWKIKTIYNPILRDVLQEYIDDGRLPNAEYVDIFDVEFTSSDVNSGDCFHPSTAGHAKLANEEWCRSSWGLYDPICSPNP